MPASRSTDPDRERKLQRLLDYLRVDPRNPRLLADASDAALELGSFDQAKLLLDQACSVEPQNDMLRFRRSHILLAEGSYEEARRLLLDLVAIGVSSPEVLYNLAYAQFGCDRMDDAVASLLTIPAAAQGRLPHYFLLLAKSLYFSGQVVAAVEPLRSYLALHAQPLEPGLCALILYDNDSAGLEPTIALAKRALSTEVADPFAHLVLGSIEVGRQEPQAAAPHLFTVAAAQPTWGRVWSVLGYMELLNFQFDRARDNFQKAVKFMPNHLGTWHGLVWTEILSNDLPAARAALNSAMELDRTFAENHGTLAVIEVLEGRTELAEPEIKRGLRLDAKSPSSHYARSLLMTARGDKISGDKLIRRLFEGAGLLDGRLIRAMQARAVGSGGASIMVPIRPGARKH